ncbi:WbuC family cupin fold metalloprotein [Salmonella enterica]|nr:cupin fold metalloprotein, WbuC family [Salmonella enterica]EAY2065751.1 cupin fold metalloprotein, WbuC family [Salmonella enterica]EBO3988612.1 cupin fold metalloprotein, WbuC family [Salmonella enterica]ECU0526783.1 cupin fold metalloprotein, WbuC family [Salmonella enterica]EFB0103817.1 cupin fold metalloprotein, WbuC family [Salmonella enterica]
MIKINKDTIDKLYLKASLSNRKRAHLPLHSSHYEKVQRIIIAFIEDSYVDPHYHELEHQWEMFVVLEGMLEVCLYDDLGNIVDTFRVGPSTDLSIIQFNPGDIHSVKCLSPKALMVEVKEGPFDEKLAKRLPDWFT